MAQGEGSWTPPVGRNASKGRAEKEAHEIRQYEKIVRLRDTVLSGSHPTIKLPPGLKALPSPISSQPKTSAESGVKTAVSKNRQSFSANVQVPELEQHAFAGTDAGAPQSVPKSFGSRNTEINPIFLEKSDELIRAELQLQRQRLERSLRDEVEQRRVSKQAQAEPLVVFDLSDVLAKALTLVQATTTPLPADEDLTANNEAASDSFDDNTFYSSRHDTPESNLTSRIRNLSEEAQVLDTSKSQQKSTSQNGLTSRNRPASPTRYNRAAEPVRPSYQNHLGSPANITISRQERVLVPGLNNYIDGGDSSAGPGPTTSGEHSQSGNLGNPGVKPHTSQLGHVPYTDMHPPSPLARNHNLLPVAPQPAQVSPLAVASEQAPAVNSGVATAVGTPAQVAALRTESGIATSPDTSSPGGRDSDKKDKKKKRKADRQAPEAEAGPSIKIEPRSPSPLTAPTYIRPNKRRRHTQGHPNEPAFAEASYARPPANNSYEQHPSQTYRDERVPIGYEGSVPYPQRAASTAVIGQPRYGRAYVDERQGSGDAYIRRPLSPGAPSYQYSREAHPTRAVSQVIVNDPYREPPRMYREPLEAPRMSVRPEGDAFVVPPKPPPTRIVVDAFGREYLEPPRPSAPPSVRPGEPGIIYERVPPRAMSGHPGAGPYDDGSVVYARPTPAYAISRRYVTQPEYVPHDYRDSRHREYSTQPMGSGEFIQVMAPNDRRAVDDRSREYVARATSIRPPEAVRFGAPQGYGRMHSVRPEAPGREYGGNMHAESHHAEGPQTYVGEYGGGPMQQPYVRREYSVRPAERYHEAQGVMRGADEIAFIERPRGATQEIVYLDDARREVYR